MSVETLSPNAAGDYTNLLADGGANWFCVADPPASPDESATIVYTNSSSQLKDAYNLANTSIPSGATINSVKVYFRFDSNYEGRVVYAQPFLRIGTDESAGTEQSHSSEAYTTYNQTLSRPGGGDWAVDDLNGLQVAIGLRRGALSAYNRCTQVYVEIDYTVVAVGRSYGFIIG